MVVVIVMVEEGKKIRGCVCGGCHGCGGGTTL